MVEQSELLSKHPDNNLADTSQASASEPKRIIKFRDIAGHRAVVWAILLLILALFWVFGLMQDNSYAYMLSLTVWGVALGGILALSSIGLTLTYGVLKFPNF